MPFRPCPFGLRSFPVRGWRTRSLSSVSGLPTRWRCVRGWLMRLLWAYEHDFIAISPFLYETIGTLCHHPCWTRGSPASALGDLRVTVRASPPGMPPRTSFSSCSEHPVRFPGDFAGLSHGAPSISFGAPSVDRMSIIVEHRGMGSRPLRMKVRWGCPPRVLSPPPHRTQSWWPCLPGQPWASGWRSTDAFALRATKVTKRSLGKVMSTMVVQERHLWLNLVEMKDVDKAHFLDAPIS